MGASSEIQGPEHRRVLIIASAMTLPIQIPWIYVLYVYYASDPARWAATDPWWMPYAWLPATLGLMGVVAVFRLGRIFYLRLYWLVMATLLLIVFWYVVVDEKSWFLLMILSIFANYILIGVLASFAARPWPISR